MPTATSQPADAASGSAAPDSELDFDIGLVVTASPVDRIVMTRIAERAGLRVVAATHDDASASLATHRPGTVILDGERDDPRCRELIEQVGARRRAGSVTAPFLIVLARAGTPRQRAVKGGPIDHVVAKPITPDRLEPLLRSLLDRVRD